MTRLGDARRDGGMMIYQFNRSPFHFWMRFTVDGCGLSLSRRPKSQQLFSERYGHRKAYYLLGFRVEWLRPATPARRFIEEIITDRAEGAKLEP